LVVTLTNLDEAPDQKLPAVRLLAPIVEQFYGR
jgi:hypothetical protein